MRAWGERLSAAAGVGRLRWRAADIATALPDAEPHDLVTLAYVLDELAPEKRGPLLDGLWRLTADLLVIVEPGTPAGWQRILAARARLLAAGAFVVAPCPHGAACPLHPPDWCHFAVHLARSRRHRLAKAAALSWEDEKFIYLAMSRQPVAPPAARVIARPQAGKGHVRLKLCRADGEAQQRVASRREGEDYRRARKLSWGSALMSQ